MLNCPICDTENKPQATHCEVCGERLTPPAPGEAVDPSENVRAMFDDVPATSSTPESSPAQSATPVGGFFGDDEPVTAAVEPVPAAPAVPAPVPAATAPAPAPVPAAPAPAPVLAAPAPAPQIRSSGIPDARLVIYQNKQPVFTHPIANDETLIGRYDPIGGSYPDLDLSEYDVESSTSRKHVYIYRQNNEFFIYPVSNAGTQVGNVIVDMGQKKALNDGDVIILSMKVAMKFHKD